MNLTLPEKISIPPNQWPRLREVAGGDTAMLAAISRLRIRVWGEYLPLFRDLDSRLDSVDLTAKHWAFLDLAGEPVASARLSLHPTLLSVPDAESYATVFRPTDFGPFASLNRLAVLPEYRGRGLASALDKARVEFARKAGARYLLGLTPSLGARIPAMEKLGFRQKASASPSKDQEKMGLGSSSAVMILPL